MRTLSAITSVLAALFVASPLAAAAQPSAGASEVALAAPKGDPFLAQLEAHKADAQARARSPEAALPLLRAFELRDRLPTLAPLVQLFRQYAEWRAVPPEVRSLARFLLASVERSRGRVSRSNEQLARLGFVTTFHAIGPFDNEGKSGCDIAYPPEEELDLAARYPGKSREVGWRRLPDGSPLGYVNLGEAIHPSGETVTYALAVVESASDAEVVFHLGASGASRMWVNQTRVFADDTYHPPRFDQAQVAVTLRKGANRVLFKLCQASGPHGFFLRISGADGRAVPGLKVSAPDQIPAAPQGAVAHASKPTLVEHFRRRAEAPRASAPALAEHAEILAHRQTFDSAEHRDANQAAKAARMAPRDVNIQMLAARTASDHNERAAFLSAALAAQPNHPEAALGLAALSLSLDLPRRALDILTPAFEQNPGYFPLGLLKARALELLGLDHQAEQLVRELARLFPDRPEIVREIASLEQRREHPREAAAFHRVALALRYDDSGARRSLVSVLIALGLVDEAMKEQRELNVLEPWSVETWLRTAELAAANGLADEAREAFARAREIAPENAEVFEREGHALARLNDTAGATASLARALELRPQDPQIKEALKALRGEGQGFGEDLARDAAKLIADSQPYEGEDSVVLSEVVATKVFPSGLASRFEQIIVRAQTPRGVEAERRQWVTYSPDRQELRILRARVIRPDGSIVESHTESERSLSDTSTRLYYDARARLISFPTLAPGDVIELSYRLDDTANDNLLSDYFGDVQALQTEALKARFDYYLFAPPGRTIYANEPGIGLEKREETQPDGSRLYHWSGRDLPKLVPEPGMPSRPEVAEPLHVSTYKDWDAVGRYYWGLVRDQLTPTDEIREQVAELKKSVPAGDELAMIQAVYDFVVSRTRYVGLEFGIHGYKPYKVDKVLARRFGDCKDKASLMHSMLRVAGIDSRLVLLRMRRLGRLKPYPASLAVFDHAILYVPKYDLFLDGTAELHGTRELPVQDRGATVLVVQPDGGSVLGEVPESKAADNVVTSEYEVTLSRSGEATISGKTVVQGMSAPSYRRTYQSPATRKQNYEQGWARTFPGLSVKELNVSDLTAIERPVELTYTMQVPRYSQREGAALSFQPFGQGQTYVESYAPLSVRQHDLVLSYPWINRSSFRIALPEGLAARELPEPVELKSPFGALTIRYTADGATLKIESEVLLAVSRVSAAEYPAFRAFLGLIDQALSRRLKAEPAIEAPTSAQAE
ncbi:MAG: DUF3857 domain-containing protein [Myxococcales bacterium]